MPKTFKKILIALSNDAEEAAKVAETGLSIAKTHAADVRILSVIEPTVSALGASVGFAAADAPTMSALQITEPTIRNREAMIKDILRSHSREIKADQTVRAGDAATEISSESESWGADLIVLGSRDRGWLGRLFDPSVSREVAQRAHCAVLILPDEA
jgi:nucleotide-binding universal stress UspA family protein